MRMFTCTAQNIYQIGQFPILRASDKERQVGDKRKKFFTYEKTTLEQGFGFYLLENNKIGRLFFLCQFPRLSPYLKNSCCGDKTGLKPVKF